MATYLQIVESIERLMGNRNDMRETIYTAVVDGVILVSALHPTPDALRVVYYDVGTASRRFDLSALTTEGDEEEGIPDVLAETISHIAYAPDGEIAEEDLETTTFAPLSKASPSDMLTYNAVPGTPVYWTIIEHDVVIYPELDQTYTLKILISKEAPIAPALTDTIPLPVALIPALRQHALAAAKMMIGESETGVMLQRYATSIGNKVVAGKARAEIHGHTGVHVVVEGEDD